MSDQHPPWLVPGGLLVGAVLGMAGADGWIITMPPDNRWRGPLTAAGYAPRTRKSSCNRGAQSDAAGRSLNFTGRSSLWNNLAPCRV
jgi:hypothetical protein